VTCGLDHPRQRTRYLPAALGARRSRGDSPVRRGLGLLGDAVNDARVDFRLPCVRLRRYQIGDGRTPACGFPKPTCGVKSSRDGSCGVSLPVPASTTNSVPVGPSSSLCGRHHVPGPTGRRLHAGRKTKEETALSRAARKAPIEALRQVRPPPPETVRVHSRIRQPSYLCQGKQWQSPTSR
jgi:hypothetical protein